MLVGALSRLLCGWLPSTGMLQTRARNDYPPCGQRGDFSAQRCFFVVVAVKSGSFLATQATNLPMAGFASNPSTSIP